MNIYEQKARNSRDTWVIVSLFILFFLFIGAGLDYFYGAGMNAPIFTISAFSVGLISSFASYMSGDKMVLFSSRAMPLDLNDPKQRQWQNVVEEMSIAGGISLPKMYIIDDPDPNAFATGRDPEHSSIAVTRGLLNTLNREEQQAVAAHEMSHIRNFDIRLMLMIAVLIGAIALVSDWAARGFMRRGSGNSRRRSSGKGEGGAVIIILVIWFIAVILAPILSRIAAMFVSRKREYLADASGAELTRNPLALATALEKISSRAEPTRSINQGTAHLCICDPKGSAIGLKEGSFADLFATHPPIHKRIEILKSMAYSNP